MGCDYMKIFAFLFSIPTGHFACKCFIGKENKNKSMIKKNIPILILCLIVYAVIWKYI